MIETPFNYTGSKYKLLEQDMFNDSTVEELYSKVLENPVKYFGEEYGNIIFI